MYIGPHADYPLLLSGFNQILIFWTDFRKNVQISNFMKIRPVGAVLFDAGGQTEEQTGMTKLIVAFCIVGGTHLKTETTLTTNSGLPWCDLSLG